jgi:hypothetical protein
VKERVRQHEAQLEVKEKGKTKYRKKQITQERVK